MDDETVQILIKAKNEAAPAMQEARIFALNFKEAVDSLNRATAEGVPIARAMRQALGELTRGLIESDLSARDQAAQIKDTRQALEKYIEVVSAGMAPESAYNAILEANTAEMVQNATATTAAKGAAAGGIPVWLGVAAAIGASVAVLWPFVMLAGSAVVALTSFAVAGAGMLALFTAVGGAFAAMGAGVLLLGGGGGVGAAAALQTATTQLSAAQQALQDFNQLHSGSLTLSQQQQKEDLTLRLAQAQQKYNDAVAAANGPTGTLIAQLSAMKDALSQQAAPLAGMITLWVGGAIPAIQALGSSMMSWFGDRLPGVLRGISRVIQNLSPDFTAFGQYFGQVMDHVGPQMEAISEAFVRLGLGAATGLLGNLVRLSDWFIKELPTLGPVVQQIFGQLGTWIQQAADHWAQLNDFVVNKWPTTVKNAESALSALNDWWKTNGDTIKTFGGNVMTLMGDLNNIIGVFVQVYDFLNGVGLGPTKLLDALNGIVGTLATIAGWVGTITGMTPPNTSGSNYSSSHPYNGPPAGKGGVGSGAGSTQTTKVVVSLSPGLIGQISGTNRRLLSV